eukprot:15430631-Alexandrium_andersonii.AAC.1
MHASGRRPTEHVDSATVHEGQPGELSRPLRRGGGRASDLGHGPVNWLSRLAGVELAAVSRGAGVY